MPSHIALRLLWFLSIFLFISWSSCGPASPNASRATDPRSYPKGTFGHDWALMQEQAGALLLERGEARVLVSTAYQGRVMSSSASGMNGRSFGWLNHDLIRADTFLPGITPVGGEDRFWLGPEGGQYGLFFPPGTSFTFDHWQTPKEIDREPFDLTERTDTSATFSREMQLSNYQGTSFDMRVVRTVELLDQEDMLQVLSLDSLGDEVAAVAFRSINRITNQGDMSWDSTTGMPSIWILGMLNPTPRTTLVIPVVMDASIDAPLINDAYFGKVPESHLRLGREHVFFKGDGRLRAKIGIPPARSTPFMGSYDAVHQVLTLVHYTLPEQTAQLPYVNSMWEQQAQPFAGDAINAYNDGPLEDGGQLGPFYELESSSPAARLAPGQALTHVHTTFHFEGEEAALSVISEAVLGISLANVREAFPDSTRTND